MESDWHRLAMTLLLELVSLHFLGREDYFAGGNMFIYFNAKQARDRDFRGPDFFFVWEAVLNPPRKYWAVWAEEGRYPNVIIELSSPSTADEDHGIKKKTYERIFRTPEYFIYDPDKHALQGWRLNGHQRYQEIQANDKGWLWSRQLGLWIGLWKGAYQGKRQTFLRFFEKNGNMVAAAMERLEASQAEIARFRAKMKPSDH